MAGWTERNHQFSSEHLKQVELMGHPSKNTEKEPGTWSIIQERDLKW